ncbi:hypothetical protein CQW23_00546 [Capsicum baccatum]|uniref:Uncharacterized protein n=1 Tax=Capsicum baccatum TaxID=33114 RepID=A0A2G2XL12_CAPBA|nr:hypothetical protein CQW23_00546 [Capsicum baccatum]
MMSRPGMLLRSGSSREENKMLLPFPLSAIRFYSTKPVLLQGESLLYPTPFLILRQKSRPSTTKKEIVQVKRKIAGPLGRPRMLCKKDQALCTNMPPERMLTFASQVAGIGCRALGARAGLPHITDPRLRPLLVNEPQNMATLL